MWAGMTEKIYATDLSDAEWAILAPLLESRRRAAVAPASTPGASY